VAGVREAISQAHHEEWVRVVASLTRRFGDLDIAEEAAAEAFAAAVERWPAAARAVAVRKSQQGAVITRHATCSELPVAV
jgi:predicted RNA polymerase sigma factor